MVCIGHILSRVVYLMPIPHRGSLDIEQDDLAVHLWEASESYTNSMLPKGLPEWNWSGDFNPFSLQVVHFSNNDIYYLVPGTKSS